MIGSLFFCIISLISALPESKIVDFNSIGEAVAYFLYFVGYTIYVIAEFYNRPLIFMISTFAFIAASVLFSILSAITLITDYSLSNVNSLGGNLAWLVGYILYFLGELEASRGQATNRLVFLSKPVG